MKATPVYHTVEQNECDELNCCLPNPFSWHYVTPTTIGVIVGEGGEVIVGEGGETFPEDQP